MTITINIKGKGTATFPDGTKPDVIKRAVKEHFGVSLKMPKQDSQFSLSNIGAGIKRGAGMAEADLDKTIGETPVIKGTRVGKWFRGLGKRTEKDALTAHPRGLVGIAGEVAGGTPTAVLEWEGKVPFAVLHGYTKGKTWEQKFRNALTEAGARVMLGWLAEMPWGRWPTAAAFPAVDAAQNRIEGDHTSWTQLGVDFVLGALTGRRLTDSQRAAFHEADSLSRLGRSHEALKVLDPVIREHAEAIAAAARDLDAYAGMDALQQGAIRQTADQYGHTTAPAMPGQAQASAGGEHAELPKPPSAVPGAQGLPAPRPSAPSPSFLESLSTPYPDMGALVRRTGIATTEGRTAEAGSGSGQPPLLPPGSDTGRPPFGFNPELTHKQARARADATLASAIARWEAVGRQVTDIGRSASYWDGRPEEERLAAIANFEKGRPQANVADAEQFSVYHQYLERLHRLENIAGVEHEYRDRYFPHFWQEPPDLVRAFFTDRVWPKAKFGKGRVFNDVQAGLDAGYRPVTTNPAELVMLRAFAGRQAAARVDAMNNLVEDGLAMPAEDAPSYRTSARVLDVGGKRYLVHPQAAHLFERAFPTPAQGFWSSLLHPGQGKMFRAWMAARNLTIPLKLSLSAYHPVHILHIHFMARTAPVLKSMLDGKITASDALKRISRVRVAAESKRGLMMASAFDKPSEELAPNERLVKDLFMAGGFQPGRPELYRIQAQREALGRIRHEIPTDWSQKRYGAAATAGLKATGEALVQVSRAIQDPLFEDWIPGLKSYTYLSEASELLTAHPELMDDPNRLRLELRRISKAIDDRYGEMQYNTLFWPQTAKNALFASFLSVGWNLGFLRQFGGAVADVGRLATDRLPGGDRIAADVPPVGRLSSKAVYASLYTLSALMMGGAMTYLVTGKQPTTKDLFYPVMPNGERVTTPFFTREMSGAYYHVRNEGPLSGAESMVGNKLTPMASSLYDLLENRDYYGSEIWNPEAPLGTQIGQALDYLAASNLSPISVSSIVSRGLQGDPEAAAYSLAGFNPSPKYADMTPTQSAIMRRYSELYGSETTAYSLERQQQAARAVRQAARRYTTTHAQQDLEAMVGALQQYLMEAPLKVRSAEDLLKMSLVAPPYASEFQRLPPESQLDILKRASPREAAGYLPFARHEVQLQYALGQQ